MAQHGWTAALIASHLNQLPAIATKLLVVPCCYWAGHEADLLVIENKLRIVDIEIKISRADLKADMAKDKWYRRRPWSQRHKDRRRMPWPEKVWKHYYAMPKEIWTPDLEAHIPEQSGVILVSHLQGLQRRAGTEPKAYAEVKRRAVPNKDAKPISQADVFNLARLENLRYWALVRKTQGICAEPHTTGD